MIEKNSVLCLSVISICFVAIAVGREAILNGHVAYGLAQFPYQAAVLINGHVFCGGGIIGNEFILTAARCALTREGHLHETRISVLVGTADQHETDKPAKIVRVTQIYVPIIFDPKNPRGPADIAVFKLERSLELTYNHELKKLGLPPNSSVNYTGEMALIAGFGWDWYDNELQVGGNSDSKLRFASVDVLHECVMNYGHGEEIGRYLCAKIHQFTRSRPRGICKNDNGGPLIRDGVAIGIASLGWKNCSEQTTGSLYTPVAHYLTFIERAMDYERNSHHWDIHMYQLH